MQDRRILLAGGGTGGHVFPLVGVIRELKKKNAQVAFIGPEEFPLDVLREEGIKIKKIVQAGKLRRYFSLKTVGQALMLPVAFLQSLFFIKYWKPQVILGKGGYGSVAPVLAARFLKIPIVLHESDILPGLATKMLARYAEAIAISYKETKRCLPDKETIFTGNPIRTKYFSINREEAGKILGLDFSRKIIFVTGASQGAENLNKLFESAAPQLLKKYAIIISTGRPKSLFFKKVSSWKNIVVRSFLNEKELAAAHVLADVIVSRAGGGIFEIAASAKPSILIPLSTSAGNHQLENARAYEETGATRIIEEKDLDGRILVLALESILENKETGEFMTRGARKFARPEAARKIANLLIKKTET